MNLRALSLATLVCLACASRSAVAQGLPAFSGAEGPGAIATGGRGGDVYHVTKLDADKNGTIAGSLQYGINNAPTAGRTIIFDVGGTIYLAGQTANDTLRYGKGNITVAGQTAPGPGITIAGTGTKWTGTNVILRNIAIRPNIAPVSYDAFSLQLKDSIVDHVSASWFTDEGISETDSGYSTTVQYAYINEGLNNVGHSYGSIIATEVNNANLAYLHNLYAHNNSRMPRLGSEYGAGRVEGSFFGATTEFSNNVIYNWLSRAGYSALDADNSTQQPSSTNFVGNYYIVGANNGSTVFLGAGNQTKIYQNGNKKDSTKNGVIDGVAITQSAWTGTNTFVASPFAVNGITNAADTADVALQRVLAYGGSNWNNRSPIDQRIASSVTTGGGAIINDLTGAAQAPEWATLLAQRPDGNGNAPFQRAANYDADNDGMPGDWETAHYLNPAVADNNGDFDSDGYTNVEEYINEIAAWPAPSAIVFNGATNNRYAQITNWDIKWQPSRFDEARIRSGTVVVDAVGQHAGTLGVAVSAVDNATLNVTGGWLDVATAMNVGAAGTGVVNHSAGAVAATSITLGGASFGPSSGTYNLSGTGALRVGTLNKGATGGVFNFTGGTLSADTVNFDLVNNGGTIAPGASPGLTYIAGNLTMNSGALLMELAGTSAGQFDKIVVDGTLAAGGTLAVNLLAGYTPHAGDTFDVLDFNSLSGSFTLNLPSLGAGLAWNSSSVLTTGALSIVAVLTPNADFNGDHLVDGNDFLIWQNGLGLAGQSDVSNGDADRDGTIDSDDLFVWRQQFGTSQGSPSGTAVPEPTAAALLVIAGIAVGSLRFRR